MKEKDFIDEIVGDMRQYTDCHHPDFDIDTSLLLIEIRPHLFTKEQISILKRYKQLESSFNEHKDKKNF